MVRFAPITFSPLAAGSWEAKLLDGELVQHFMTRFPDDVRQDKSGEQDMVIEDEVAINA